ncbi:acyl carrier protein [Bacteroides fluxus]|uniref:acyl carrier protein n=1 Tax=Bacteroides fluxus TaxID=626930 RepID=UPI0023576B31|nr:acyl carrier protein [Bacteroides fluxus]
MDVRRKVISIIAETLNVDESVITPEMAAGDIEQWDSMGNVAILTTVESELGVDFPMEELFELNTVESIVDKVIELKHV